MSRTNHGCIACNACSHVTPEVFFGAQVNHRHKQIRYGSEDQMVMEPLPRPALIVVQSQVRFAALEELLDWKTSPT